MNNNKKIPYSIKHLKQKDKEKKYINYKILFIKKNTNNTLHFTTLNPHHDLKKIIFLYNVS